MGVLENHQRGIRRAMTILGDQRASALAGAARSEAKRRITASPGQRRRFRRSNVFAGRRRTTPPAHASLSSLSLWFVFASEAGRPSQLRNDRVKGAVHMASGVAQPLVGFARQPLHREPRLADASNSSTTCWFAAFAVEPASQQLFGFLVSPRERGQPVSMKRFEPALTGTFPSGAA